jgi:release factor glutamine methyltransferase
MYVDWELGTDEVPIGRFFSILKSHLSNWSETPSLDAQVLLAHISGKNRAWVLAHPEALLTPEQQNALRAAVSRLEGGEPLPYVLGYWAFYGLEFIVNTETLIPRPETELVVEEAIKWLLVNPTKRCAADIGTGSGCIAIALAVNIPDLQVTATDISLPAIRTAQTNAKKHGVAHRVDFVQADLLTRMANRSPFHVICANLPYIPTKTLEGLDVYNREPTIALDGGPDGLGIIHKLLPQVLNSLAPAGLVLLEIESSQGETSVKLAQEFFPEAQIDLLRDLADHDRLLRIETFAEL